VTSPNKERVINKNVFLVQKSNPKNSESPLKGKSNMEKYSPFCFSLLNDGSLKTANPESGINPKKTVFRNDGTTIMNRSKSVLNGRKDEVNYGE
jgi:hypothetical protein